MSTTLHRVLRSLIPYASAMCCLLPVKGAFAGDAAAPVHLVPVGRYATGSSVPGAAEIVAHHAPSRQLYSVNTDKNKIDIVSIANPRSPEFVREVSLADFGAIPTSVTASARLIAASVLPQDPHQHGQVVFFEPDGKLLGAVTVGYHPDMVMFTPDGRRVIVANEGEPSADGQFDGEGSVSVITVPPANETAIDKFQVIEAGFGAWNDDARPFPENAHRVDRAATVSQDFEPEGIAISEDSKLAYITLQESNAVAIVDLAAGEVVRILGLGYKDHNTAGNEFDTRGDGSRDSLKLSPVKGLYQPDNIGYLRVGDKRYLLLANEGDARGNDKFSEEIAVKDAKLDPVRFPNAADLQRPEQLGSLIVSLSGDVDQDGDLDELYSFGGRSFSIISDDGQLVFESGHQLEDCVSARLSRMRIAHPEKPPTYRVKKGPEPEGLTLGHCHNHVYAFVGLERDSGIATYDVTDPTRAALVDYIHPAEQFGGPNGIAADIAPEGLCFIAAADNNLHEPMLAVANEVSGSITLYAIRQGHRQQGGGLQAAK
ncbi:MAG: choice-of-anchor I family protein [Planctomycetales bacterium]|nr:choice-of-anchor I family protein [Planctomycetales bacterium]